MSLLISLFSRPRLQLRIYLHTNVPFVVHQTVLVHIKEDLDGEKNLQEEEEIIPLGCGRKKRQGDRI